MKEKITKRFVIYKKVGANEFKKSCQKGVTISKKSCQKGATIVDFSHTFSVSSIFVCPKYFATNVTLAPLLIKRVAHECLKSGILIRFKLALLPY